MIQHEFEELLEQFSQDELNEKSTVKGQFTSYITRRMEWHAIRYAAKNRPNAFVRHCIIQGVISGVVMVIGIPLCVLTNKITNYTKVR